jgi:hypothetical protein
MRQSTKTLLARLAAGYPCVVISGRALKDVRARLRGVGMQGLVEPRHRAVEHPARHPEDREMDALPGGLRPFPGW